MRMPFNTGWFVRPKQSAFLEMTGISNEAAPVTLPHDAMIGTARDPAASHANAYFAPGSWQYSKRFDVPESWADRRVRLQFEGVYRDAMVYVNHDFAGQEPNGYGEFVVDLDPFLLPGRENQIVVDCRAGDDTRWYSGAGIHRPVHLWVQAPVHLAVDGVVVTTPEIDAALAVVEVAAEVRNDTHRTVTVRVSNVVCGPEGRDLASATTPVTVRPQSTVIARRRLTVDQPDRWHPDSPTLHTLSTVLFGPDGEELERRSTVFGIRSIRLDPRNGLRINDDVVKLRGACVHHDNGPIGAAAITRADERRVELLKEAGFNAIRSAHNPASRALLDACDRVGMVVMDELSDMWTEPKSDQDHGLRFADRWRQDAAAMVRKDRNHPSVVLYSTGNEIQEVGSPLGAALARDIAEEIRALDPTRYVTNGIQPFLAIRDMITELRAFAAGEDQARSDGDDEPQGVNSMMTQFAALKDRFMASDAVDECLAEVSASLDVAGYNYLDVRYPIDGELHPERVIVGSETYASAIGRAWPVIRNLDHVIGDFTWTGWDYLGEAGIGRTEFGTEPDPTPASGAGVAAPFPWLLAHTGDLDILGTRRPQSYFREIVFGLRSEPFIAVQRPRGVGRPVTFAGPWSWPDALDSWTWSGVDGTELTVWVYSDADEVELRLDDALVGRLPAGAVSGFAAEFSVAYRPGELTAVAFTAGIETGRSTLRTAGAPSLVAVVDRPEIVAGDDDLAFVAVSIADDAGIVHPEGCHEVSIEIDGPAELVGFASADPASTESYATPVCSTYDGRALAVVRPTGSGPVEIALRADGFVPTVCRIAVLDR